MKTQETQLAKQNQNSLINYAKNREEMELSKAIGDVRLRNITKGDAERLIEVVGKWGFYMGASNRLTSDDILLLCKFLRENYNHLTINEISLAINLNLKRVFGDIEYFGSLSPVYMSEVLNSYEDYKRDVMRPVVARRERENTPQSPTLTKKEEYNMICDALKNEYSKFKQGAPINDTFSILYNFLAKSGRIQESLEKLEEAKAYAIRAVEKNAKKEAKTIGDLINKSYMKEGELEKYRQLFFIVDLFSTINDINSYIEGINISEIS